MSKQHPFIRICSKISLVTQIAIGLIAGILFAYFSKEGALQASLLGDWFINALKSVAPILVLILVASAIARHREGNKNHVKSMIFIYLIGMISASIIAAVASFMFPSTISLISDKQIDLIPPSGVSEVIIALLNKMIDNPFNALINANYIGLIVWGVGLGLALRHANESTKVMIDDLSFSISYIVKIVIRFAPLGIFGLMASMIAETGFNELFNYAHLLIVLVSCMLVVALIINPIIAFIVMRKNPYSLVLTALKESGLPAFFTRSSAANIPVNMELCKKLQLDKDIYSFSIPLGATVNMSGAAVTITILTLAAVNTLNIPVDPYSAILLCILSAVCACGSSGIAGGSLLLIPVACSLFGIPNEVAVKVIAIGLAIGVIQDSVETAVNSSTDVIFTSALCNKHKQP